MEHVIPVSVHRKVARNEGKLTYVCGNSDYVIEFSFDGEWDGLDVKTARFKSNGKVVDVVFTGNRCEMPVMSDTYSIEVGVFAGNLKTTTPAVIMAQKSILCGEGVPADPPPEVYTQIMEMLNQGGVKPEDVAKAIQKYLAENPIEVEERDPTVPAWAKQPKKPTYTPEEIGAQPVGDYALRSEIPAIPAPYDLPTASATVKGGVRVGDGLQMTGDVLGVVPEQELELIETITLEEEAVVSRSKEPDGNAYNFEEIFVKFIKPESVGTVAGFNMRVVDGNNRMGQSWMSSVNNTSKTFAYFNAYYKRGKFVVDAKNWSVVQSSGAVNSDFPTFDGPIVRIATSIALPAGITIEIWGGRA